MQKAFALDENSADVYGVQGFRLIFYERDWTNAEKSLKTALELDATNVNAHHWLSVYFSIQRRLDEAKTEMQKALEIDPTNPTLLADFGQIYYFSGENGKAVDFYNQAIAFEPNHLFAVQYLAQINAPQEVKSKDTTLNELEKAADAHDFTLPFINIDPKYDSLRQDLRFKKSCEN